MNYKTYLKENYHASVAYPVLLCYFILALFFDPIGLGCFFGVIILALYFISGHQDYEKYKEIERLSDKLFYLENELKEANKTRETYKKLVQKLEAK